MKWIYPAPTRYITCGFYCYQDHNADDFGCVYEPCWAMREGKVKTAYNPMPANYGHTGKYIELLHDDGWVTRYFHLSRIDVLVGERVEQGQQIGITGATGFTTSGQPYAPHLHIAMWAPTREEALTVWAEPRLSYGMWAVDPAWVIETQPKEDDDLTPDQAQQLTDMKAAIDRLVQWQAIMNYFWFAKDWSDDVPPASIATKDLPSNAAKFKRHINQ